MADQKPNKYSESDLLRTRQRILDDIIDELIAKRYDISYSGCDRMCFIRIAEELEQSRGKHEHDKCGTLWDLPQSIHKAHTLDLLNPNEFNND